MHGIPGKGFGLKSLAVSLTIGALLWVCPRSFGWDDIQKRVVPLGQSTREVFDKLPKVAVLVGVGAYPRQSGWGRLNFAGQDASTLAQVLGDQGYKVRVVTDAEANSNYIRGALLDAGKLIDKRDGTFIFFFSGHGFERAKQIYLATYDSLTSQLDSSGLALSKVQELMEATGARRRVLWVDACRVDEGTGAKGPVDNRAFTWLASATGTRTLYASGTGQPSYESQELHHGVFTAFLVDGLRGAAAREDGLVTERDLADFVADRVQKYSFAHGQLQVPFDAGESDRDFLIARAIAARAEQPSMPSGTLPHALVERFVNLSSRKEAVELSIKKVEESLRLRNVALRPSLLETRNRIDKWMQRAEVQMAAGSAGEFMQSLDSAEKELDLLEAEFGIGKQGGR